VRSQGRNFPAQQTLENAAQLEQFDLLEADWLEWLQSLKTIVS
jgi:hypothetical protein